MGDPHDKDANTFIVYLDNDPIVSDTVALGMARPHPRSRQVPTPWQGVFLA